MDFDCASISHFFKTENMQNYSKGLSKMLSLISAAIFCNLLRSKCAFPTILHGDNSTPGLLCIYILFLFANKKLLLWKLEHIHMSTVYKNFLKKYFHK